jgi:hypothetical protein
MTDNSQHPNYDQKKIRKSFEQLKSIISRLVGSIILPNMDIELLTEIFVRINSNGKPLNQTDFVMSKIAADTTHNGDYLWKTIEYFCRTAKDHKFWETVKKDQIFASTKYVKMIKWLKNNKIDLYIPEHSDLIRVVFVSQFNRGKISEFVSLLSGRNFDKKIFEEVIIEDTFKKLDEGIQKFTNETNYKSFLDIIKTAGFCSPSLIPSNGVLNFAYILYLKLKTQQRGNDSNFEHIVRRWFVFSILTSRYGSSQETTFDEDIKRVSSDQFDDYFERETKLPDDFWDNKLPNDLLVTSSVNNPFLIVFWASQVKASDKGFLSSSMPVGIMIDGKNSDIHHLFPKDYLKKAANKTTKEYNQVANFVYTKSGINKSINNKPPSDYMVLVKYQMTLQNRKKCICNIKSDDELNENLRVNCIPSGFDTMEAKDYDTFLNERRKLMAQKIREYYESL